MNDDYNKTLLPLIHRDKKSMKTALMDKLIRVITAFN